jgi:FKBP-type peptidyl-prolyl cis-trans isomerase
VKPTIFRLLFILGLFSTFISCQKEQADPFDAVKQAADDDALIQSYLKIDTISNAVKTPSGLYYAIRKTGNGTKIQAGNTVKVDYIGRFLNNEIFDSSYKYGTPFSVTVGAGGVIKGWDEGLQLMNKGEKALLYIPSALAYGRYGSNPIPPNTVLKFEISVRE